MSESHWVHKKILELQYFMIEWDRDPICEETKENLSRLGIHAVLFDLDDTLIYTSEIFRLCINEYVKRVSEETGIDPIELKSVLEQIEKENYMSFGVNPKRWMATIQGIASRYPKQQISIKNNLPILLNIYEIEPRMKEGAKTVLETLQNTGVKKGLVTHGNVNWSYWKIGVAGIWDYFDSVKIADEDGHKSAGDWLKVMEDLEVEPKNCLVVGDNLAGDIRAGAELGARTVWMPSTWSVYKSGAVPESTVQIEKISDMLAALGQLR